MGRPEYLIAKFIPDLFRNEPMNIGVIVWSDGTTSARFVGTQPDGRINGTSLPGDLKKAHAAYKQWADAWNRMLEQGVLKCHGSGNVILKANSCFLEAFQKTGTGNFILERGGELVEEVPNEEIQEVTDYLFERLVTKAGNVSEPSKTAEEVRDDLLKEAHVNALITTQVKLDKKLKVTFGNKIVHHEFHLYIGNGSPKWLGHVIPLTHQPKDVKKTADSVAWRFSGVSQQYKIPRDHCVAIVYATESRQEDLIQESLTELESVARIEHLDSTKPKIISEIQAMVEAVKKEQH